MRIICDVCPSTAGEGQTVVIGHYEKWIRHLLTPQHQTEQNLVMARTTYWPEASWIAMVKNLPVYSEANADLYVDALMSLSEYGFVEALYYGSKTKDSICVAFQWYETKPVPSYLIGPDNSNYPVKLIPKVPTNASNGIRASRLGRKRVGFVSESSGVSIKVSSRDVATSPIKNVILDDTPSGNICPAAGTTANIQGGGRQEPKKRQIKYDRDTLLLYCKEKAMPARFVDVLTFPLGIIEEEAKEIDRLQLEELQNVKWVTTDQNPGNWNVNKHRNNNGVAGYVAQNRPFGRTLQGNQNGSCGNDNSRWPK